MVVNTNRNSPLTKVLQSVRSGTHLCAFRSWMAEQEWGGEAVGQGHLISKGNRVYSSNTCVFVDKVVNTFPFLDSAISRADSGLLVFIGMNKIRSL